MMLLQQCAWICGEPEPVEFVKPVPVGGYESLAARIHYPETVRALNVEGTVVVNALISIDGEVKKTRVVEAIHPDLDLIVTNAIKRTSFMPATRKGQPEEVWISIPFVFALKDWIPKSTPFSDFSMTIYPDAAYKTFDVELKGRLKNDVEWPLRFECLLPFNSSNPWVRVEDGPSPAMGTVRDDGGEWLIFQVSSLEVTFGFTYKVMEELPGQKFLYEFALNHALPDWELLLIYGDQTVAFSQTPDRTVIQDNGETRFEYDLKHQNAFESRFLEIDLQK